MGRRQKFAGNVTLACGGFVLVLLAFRLGQIQHVHHGEYLSEKESQSRVRMAVEPVRGKILDRKGHELALSCVKVKSLFAVPGKVVAPACLARILAPTLSMDAGDLLTLLTKKRKFVWLKRKLDSHEEEALRALQHPALGFRDEQKRFYPKRRTASHVIGFVGVDNDGLEGAEAAFEAQLRGTPGYRWFAKDALQERLAILDEDGRPAVDGNDVWLTLDLYVQEVVEDELRRAWEAWAPLSATCIVMHPGNGAVLAMANLPDYDPAGSGTTEPAHRRNRAITDPYEPGSTFKPFAVAAALDAGVVTPDTVIDCAGRPYTFRSGRVKRTLHDFHYYGRLPVTLVLAKSSNIGTVKVALRMSDKAYRRSLADLDVEALTGIELPGEGGGWMAPNGWSFFSRTSVPWGQEVAVTPMKLLTLFNALVNGGLLMRPSVLRKVVSPEGEVLQAFAPVAERRIVSEKTSAAMREIMHATVKKGTARRAKIEGYEYGGKTGTKTKYVPRTKEEMERQIKKSHEYSMKKSICSFICFAPADRPVVSLLVVVDEPSKGAEAHWLTGGKVAAPIAKAVLQRILPYLGIRKKEE